MSGTVLSAGNLMVNEIDILSTLTRYIIHKEYNSNKIKTKNRQV